MTTGYTLLRFPEEFYAIFYDPNYERSISLADAKRKDQVNYICRYLRELNCQSILVEYDYVDHDYLDDYANYYAKCFGEYKRFCRRAHFWRTDVTNTPFEDIIIDQAKAKIDILKRDYLGFVVIKPLPNAVVGRTVLGTWSDDGGKRKYRAIRDYTANLYGLELSVSSLAFQEQDTVLAACATSALWCAFQMTSKLFGTCSPTPSEITRCATQYIQTTRPVPSKGLRVEQICYAISENGLAPEVQQINPDTALNSLIYAYVSAGIPLILGYEIEGTENRHAVTICGYRLESAPKFNHESRDENVEMNLIGRRISELYVHDDNIGPFSRLICDNAGDSQGNSRIFTRTLESRPEIKQICVPELVIAPVYHKIRIQFNDLLGAVRKINRYFKALGIDISTNSHPAGIEWEIRLFDLTSFRQKVIALPTIARDDKRSLLFSNFAKYAWTASARFSNTRIFSFVADATDIARSFYFRHFIEHIPGIRENIASIIRRCDPQLETASGAGLQSAFVAFLRKEILLL